MTTIRFRVDRLGPLFVALLFASLAGPAPASGQCLGASAVEDFAANMKGCATTVEFAARAATCAPDWHVCSAEEWAARSGGKPPTYNYWTNDPLRYNSSSEGCFVSLNAEDSDCGDTPMRVCTIAAGDFDGAYQSASRYYTLATYALNGSLSVLAVADAATLEVRAFTGPLVDNVFTGTLLGGSETITLTFTGAGGHDGTEPFSRLADQLALVGSDFRSVSDPLGNHCNWHACGLGTATPNLYFGGCAGNTSAGVLCCQ